MTKYPMRWWFPEETYKHDANNPNQGFVPSRWPAKAIGQIWACSTRFAIPS